MLRRRLAPKAKSRDAIINHSFRQYDRTKTAAKSCRRTGTPSGPNAGAGPPPAQPLPLGQYQNVSALFERKAETVEHDKDDAGNLVASNKG